MPTDDVLDSGQHLRDYVLLLLHQLDAWRLQLTQGLTIGQIYLLQVLRCRGRDRQNVETYVAIIERFHQVVDFATPICGISVVGKSPYQPCRLSG